MSRVGWRKTTLEKGCRALIVHNLFAGGYFFWITEALPRLWAVRDRWSELELFLPAHTPLTDVMAESVYCLPLKGVRWFPKDRNIAFDTLLLPENSAFKANFDPRLLLPIREFYTCKVAGYQPAQAFRRVYIARDGASYRQLANEEQVQSLVRTRGFEIVRLEQLSFLEQVKLMAETRILIGPHGAGFSNMVFMPEGSAVLEFQLRVEERKTQDIEDGYLLNKSFCRLASCMGLGYAVLTCEGEGAEASVKARNLSVDIENLVSAIDAVEADSK